MASLPLLVGAAGALKGNSTPKAPKPIPMPDVEEQKRQQRRKYAGMASAGRASTILTDTGGLG